MVPRTYPTGIKITDRKMKFFERTRLNRHHFHGNWNYTIHPATHTRGSTPRKINTLIQDDR